MDTIGWSSIQGRTIVEVGPGDAIPLALLFLGTGAKKYIAFDRFIGDVLNASSLALYKAIEADLPEEIKAGWHKLRVDCSRAGLEDLFARDMISLLPISIEEATTPDVADFIVSFNVLEHLSDMEQALRRMAIILKPDGMMIHRVDYGPHDVWSRYRNQLTFLVLPDWLWRLMGSNRGYPNRTRHSEVMSILAGLGFSTAERIVRRFEPEDVADVKLQRTIHHAHLNDQNLTPLVAEFASSRTLMPTLGESFPY